MLVIYLETRDSLKQFPAQFETVKAVIEVPVT
jgi:hypothetical protein